MRQRILFLPFFILFLAEGCGNPSSKKEEEGIPDPVTDVVDMEKDPDLKCDFRNFNLDSLLDKDLPRKKMSLEQARASFMEQAKIYQEHLHSSPGFQVVHRPGGWARNKTGFLPFTNISVVPMEGHPGHFIARYEFLQLEYWGSFYRTKDSAENETTNAKMDTTIHRHSAIWFQNKWQVYERFNLSPEDVHDFYPELRCDEVQEVHGSYYVKNYDECREDDEPVCLFVKAHFYEPPIDAHLLNITHSVSNRIPPSHSFTIMLDQGEPDFVSIIFEHNFSIYDPKLKCKWDYAVQFIFGESKNVSAYTGLKFDPVKDKLYEFYRSSLNEAARLNADKIDPHLFKAWLEERSEEHTSEL